MPRPRLIALLSLCLALAASPFAAAEEVSLAKGEKVVTATIGNEGFLAYQFNVGRKKPFFLPVAAAGGFEELKKRLDNPGSNQDQLLNSVFVIAEGAIVRSTPRSRDAKSKLNFGELLVASKIEGDVVHIPEKDGWVSTMNVVPIASTVVRLINDAVPMIKIPQKDPRYYDHPHHKGIWFSIDEINGLKHWAEGHNIVNKSVDVVTPKGETAVMKVVNHWVNEKDEPVLEESTTVRIHSNRLIDYDAELKAIAGPVTFGHTKEGMFAVRVPNSMREIMEGAKVESDTGVVGAKKLWGQPTPWIDYDGKIGDATFGVAVMDHPGNFRPSRYHVRDYGLFAISPFGDPDYTGGKVQTPKHELKQGESVRLRYAAYPHPGETKAADVAGVYKTFAESK
ncbi:MAG TPA: PmoA family protein [Caulifigura sp.]|nr:PmoA family protein [Caulifigura sp.]